MLTLHLKSGRVLSLNLKSFDREKALRDAWYSMHGDDKYADKKFRVTTTDGHKYEIRVSDIAVLEHSPVEYYKVSPEDVHTS